ncbi:CPBP family intramembrane glutamic endopeptidase [Ruminococcus sp.]|uniref:CPBP family intramembrane glutamic endopeptidase n=1 Tax=Ruminococcus sp. TaxID=41978 RepID=UPI001B43072A|nr:CPBP family intramembrane glutamic endopeptidase [Ruminococcus sp.]MBP5431110.1 CPBP family intramembrane metalloprotease [Ruminococcus sp.]
MGTTEKRLPKNKALIIYIIAFYTIWALFEFFGKPVISDIFPGEISSEIVNEVVIKNLVWILPAALLVHHYKDDVCIGLKEMFTTKVKWQHYLPVFLLFVLYPLVSAYRMKGSLSLSSDFGAKEVIDFSFVGITEEMVFRGWLLNAMTGKNKQNQWKAILLSSLLFVAIHIPTWTIHGKLSDAFLHFGFIQIIILSVIFSITFLKSRNILIPVTLHMIWDFLLSMF